MLHETLTDNLRYWSNFQGGAHNYHQIRYFDITEDPPVETSAQLLSEKCYARLCSHTSIQTRHNVDEVAEPNLHYPSRQRRQFFNLLALPPIIPLLFLLPPSSFLGLEVFPLVAEHAQWHALIKKVVLNGTASHSRLAVDAFSKSK